MALPETGGAMFKALRLLCVSAFLLCAFYQAPAKAAGELPVPGSTNTVSAANVIEYIGAQKGKVVVMNFYAAWCPPCRMEIPMLINIHNSYSRDDLVIVGISLDKSDKEYRDFITRMGIEYPTFRAGPGVVEAFRVSSIPEMFYYTRDNKLSERVAGLTPEKNIRARIDALLKE
jgi:thiol-disulfide isomerase/thioredoxin